MQDKLAEHYNEFGNYLQVAKHKFASRMKDTIVSKYDINDFTVIKSLGHGAFGRVMLVKHKTKDIDFYHAVKVMEKKHIVETRQIIHTKSEVRLLYATKCDFIINMEAFFKNNVYIFLLMPYIGGGDMFGILREQQRFEESLSKFYAGQVVLAFEYMHYMGMVYRDLKPENIMIEQTGYIKITDFGFCKKIDGERTYTLCGTPDYIAPEAIMGLGYNESVDWWGLGVLIYEMVAGYTPFYSNNPIKTYEKIVTGKYLCPPHFSRALKDVVGNILQVDRTKRFGMLTNGSKDIKCHGWFCTLDWVNLFHQQLTPAYRPPVTHPEEGIKSSAEEFFRNSAIDEFGDEFETIA